MNALETKLKPIVEKIVLDVLGEMGGGERVRAGPGRG